MAEYIEKQSLIDAIYSDGNLGAYAEYIINRVPSADVAPVRHGRWGKNNDCSECGCQPWFERDIHTLNYCPNCGAKMDGGDKSER